MVPVILILFTLSCTKDKDDDPPENKVGDVELTLINEAVPAETIAVLIFQLNQFNKGDAEAIAWRVVPELTSLAGHFFDFHVTVQGDVNDYEGNSTQMLELNRGTAYEAVNDASGMILRSLSESSYPDCIEVKNHCNFVVNSNIYRNGKLLANKGVLVPDTKAVYDFKHSIYVAVWHEHCPYIEGEAFSIHPILDKLNKLDLTGIESADIVVSGNHEGEYKVDLENIKYVQ